MKSNRNEAAAVGEIIQTSSGVLQSNAPGLWIVPI
jgi:hypothetical protein